MEKGHNFGKFIEKVIIEKVKLAWKNSRKTETFHMHRKVP